MVRISAATLLWTLPLLIATVSSKLAGTGRQNRVPAENINDLLKKRGFLCFLAAQFLGALNDNFYRWTICFYAVALMKESEGQFYVAIAAAVFQLPYFFFSGYAGYLADVHNKRIVLISTKSMEIAAMTLGVLGFITGNVYLMLFVLFLMALQSALFSPAKYGILPEMVSDRQLSRANGLLEMTTYVAIILGTALAGLAYKNWNDQLVVIGIVALLIAIVGTLLTFGISRVPNPSKTKPFLWNPWAEIISGIREIMRMRSLWLTVLGIGYFFFLALLVQQNVIFLAKSVLAVDESKTGILLAIIGIGIGLGSIAAGRLSGEKVELGLVPLGSLGMVLSCTFVYFAVPHFQATALALGLLGFSSGIFIVPLNAFLQQRSASDSKGKLIASSNFVSTCCLLLAAAAFWGFGQLKLSPEFLFVLLAGLTIVSTFIVMKLLPDALIRFSLWLITHTFYRIRIVGYDNIPYKGPALLVCNHVSHVDALLVGSCVQRFVRFMMYAPYYRAKSLHWLFKLMKSIPVSGEKMRDILSALDRARDALKQGHVVCIFAEGGISRTGNMLPFKRGFEKIIEGLDIPIIPVNIDRIWGSIFSFKEGRFFWKWPNMIPYPVTVSFGKPLPSSAKAHEVRLAVMELGSDAARYRRSENDLLHFRFMDTAKRNWRQFCMADSMGQSLTFGKALIASLLLAKQIRKSCGDAKMLGIILPASVAGALANIAAMIAGKAPVNLNFTAGREAMSSAMEQCEIIAILSSRVFLTKAKIEPMEGMVFVEDLFKSITKNEKMLAAVQAFLLPAWALRLVHARSRVPIDGLATVIFSSGSTGTPKGVMLSHNNIVSNVESFAQVFWVTGRDCIMGVLPLFHSFGFTGTMWFPLLGGFGVVFHANPTDAAKIGEMVEQHKATILISTPTFFSLYIRKCTTEQFASLTHAVVGAERLRETIATAYKEKFGMDLLEGYGCTEMSPVIAVNVPDVEHGKMRQTGFVPGTVGHPVPGVAAKVISPETGEPQPPGSDGMLLVKGPNRMMGYLNQPERTAEVFMGDWYVTGDIASIDDRGFIKITDRLSRFSKIAGEMAPHLRIEDAINQILGEPACAVTGVPDEEKGEKLVAIYTKPEFTPEIIWEQLGKTDLPKLWIPKRECFIPVETIPLLGTGKVDLRGVKTLAKQLMEKK